jgi:methylated-DNA-[protein]-cysteine S-methyltransferase
METYCTWIETPIGPLLLAGNGQALTAIRFGEAETSADPGWKRATEPFREAIRQLAEYFARQRTRFDLPLAPSGTPFEQRVWHELRLIPWGRTVSYREIAQRIGQPRGVRAVARAIARNPLPIVIPCHRVIGADGSLVGFAGGLEVKRRLLELEGGLVSVEAERPKALDEAEAAGDIAGNRSSLEEFSRPGLRERVAPLASRLS